MKNFSGEKKGGGAYFRKHVYFEFHIQQGHLCKYQRPSREVDPQEPRGIY